MEQALCATSQARHSVHPGKPASAGAAAPAAPAGRARTGARLTEFFYCEDYQQGGPRVILLSGPWRDAMRRHYGICRPPFFRRAATSNEPEKAPGGHHPWGWAYKPHEVFLDEERLQPAEVVEALRQALAAELRALGSQDEPQGLEQSA